MTDTYRIRAMQVWAQARRDYLSGLSAETVCRRHELGLSAFRRRARKYGWRRSDQIESPPDETDLSLYDDIEMHEQAATARLRFVQALEQGKATEARRWRALWRELCDENRKMNQDIFQGMSREQIAAVYEDDRLRTESEDFDLLGPPPCD